MIKIDYHWGSLVKDIEILKDKNKKKKEIKKILGVILFGAVGLLTEFALFSNISWIFTAITMMITTAKIVSKVVEIKAERLSVKYNIKMLINRLANANIRTNTETFLQAKIKSEVPIIKTEIPIGIGAVELRYAADEVHFLTEDQQLYILAQLTERIKDNVEDSKASSSLTLFDQEELINSAEEEQKTLKLMLKGEDSK